VSHLRGRHGWKNYFPCLLSVLSSCPGQHQGSVYTTDGGYPGRRWTIELHDTYAHVYVPLPCRSSWKKEKIGTRYQDRIGRIDAPQREDMKMAGWSRKMRPGNTKTDEASNGCACAGLLCSVLGAGAGAASKLNRLHLRKAKGSTGASLWVCGSDTPVGDDDHEGRVPCSWRWGLL